MKYQEFNPLDYEHIIKEYGVSTLCAKVLASNSLNEKQYQQIFSEPCLSNPFDAIGIIEIVDRFKKAKEMNEKVLVCGDYDADGICATAILYQALQKYGITCGYYIPNRFKEGYGLNANTVHLAKEKGYSLLITVDNGVKSFEAAALASELDIELIITDHHSYEDLPSHSLFLHPQLMGDHFIGMSGAGLSLMMSRALIGEDKLATILAGVATIGDVMPLWNENRSIVRFAIQYLKEGHGKSIQRLLKRGSDWDETTISFQVVPKLNVTGRLSDIANANITVRYLLSNDENEIIKCAKQIEELNELRKIKSEEMSRKAYSMVDPKYSFQVIYDEDFHEGLVGLVAGKLANELHKTVMILTRKEDELRGSIRSMGDVDLRDFFDPCKELFHAYGGHKKAAGVGFAKDQLKSIRDFVNEAMDKLEVQEDIIIDYIGVDFNKIDQKEVISLRELAPFGEGFRLPIFAIKQSDDMKMKSMSSGKHLKWENEMVDILYFNQGKMMPELKMRKDMTFFGSLSLSTFMNRTKINMIVQDIT